MTENTRTATIYEIIAQFPEDERIKKAFGWCDFEAYAETCPDSHPFAQAIDSVIRGHGAVIAGGRPIPVRWLWHGGRLLPATLLAAGRLAGIDVTPCLIVPPISKIGLIPRVCTKFFAGLEDAVTLELEKLPRNAGLFDLDPMIADFMHAIVKAGKYRNDAFSWKRYESGGVDRLIRLRAPPTWKEELRREATEFVKNN
ncbi:MAG TPA: hypothetical protein HPQ04_04460 [Rhodospirillaceae bacterium]|nr:hypothetical protein [Rhodospirillaceae bacterium]